MAGKESHRVAVALMVVAIACSATSLGMIIFRPATTGSWRTALNVTALLLLIGSTTNLARIIGRRNTRS